MDGANCYSMYQLAPIDITMSFIIVNGSECVSSKKVILYSILWFCEMFFELLDDLLLPCQLEYLLARVFSRVNADKNSHCKTIVFANPLLRMAYS